MATRLTHAVPALPEAAHDVGVRGIYLFEHAVEGCPAYFALTSRGEVTGRGLRVVWPGDSRADIVAQLDSELRAVDPIRPTYLTLHVDGPAARPEPMTLTEALDLETVDFARWLYQ